MADEKNEGGAPDEGSKPAGLQIDFGAPNNPPDNAAPPPAAPKSPLDGVEDDLDAAEVVLPDEPVPASGDEDGANVVRPEPGDESGGRKRGKKRGKPIKSTVLFNLIVGKIKLWLGEDDEAYATFPQGGHWENWPVKSKLFSRFLVREFYASQGNAPGVQTINEAIALCEVRAWDSAAIHPTFVRVGELDGDLWIDLGDPDWRCVRVRPHQWTIEPAAPIKFVRRSNEMRPLPAP